MRGHRESWKFFALKFFFSLTLNECLPSIGEWACFCHNLPKSGKCSGVQLHCLPITLLLYVGCWNVLKACNNLDVTCYQVFKKQCKHLTELGGLLCSLISSMYFSFQGLFSFFSSLLLLPTCPLPPPPPPSPATNWSLVLLTSNELFSKCHHFLLVLLRLEKIQIIWGSCCTEVGPSLLNF